jgi:hypothetical protein
LATIATIVSAAVALIIVNRPEPLRIVSPASGTEASRCVTISGKGDIPVDKVLVAGVVASGRDRIFLTRKVQYDAGSETFTASPQVVGVKGDDINDYSLVVVSVPKGLHWEKEIPQPASATEFQTRGITVETSIKVKRRPSETASCPRD